MSDPEPIVTQDPLQCVLAIDPGNVQSGWCIIELLTRQPVPDWYGVTKNEELREMLSGPGAGTVKVHVAIEQIGHYGTGMPAGQTVFDTCVWIGRYLEVLHRYDPVLVMRAAVKLHLCGSAKAKDSNVIQALVDRFAPGSANHGKGTKAEPGWFHGFKKDAWQACALAVYYADMLTLDNPVAQSAAEGAPS